MRWCLGLPQAGRAPPLLAPAASDAPSRGVPLFLGIVPHLRRSPPHWVDRGGVQKPVAGASGGGMKPSHTGVTGLLHSHCGLSGHHWVNGSLYVDRSLHIFSQGTQESYSGSILGGDHLQNRVQSSTPPHRPPNTISLAVFNGVRGEEKHTILSRT